MQQGLIGFIIAFFSSLLLAPFIIKLFEKIKNGQPILNYVESHFVKKGTPTMGGVIFIVGSLFGLFVLNNDNIRFLVICLASMIGYGLLGFLDDFIKVKLENNQGLKAYQKAIGQVGIALLVSYFVFNSAFTGSDIIIPFTTTSLDVGWLIIPFIIFVYLATTNGVNLIDGLDGLSGSVSFVYLIGFGLTLSYYINHLKNVGESMVVVNEYSNILMFTFALAGAILAFLIFNSHKAKIFMGDTGSMAIGGFIAASAVMTKLYLYIPFYGFMFVLTSASVIIQVLYYKATKKRVFLMAPLHHHFEKKGHKETKIVSTYSIVTIVISVVCLYFLYF